MLKSENLIDIYRLFNCIVKSEIYIKIKFIYFERNLKY